MEPPAGAGYQDCEAEPGALLQAYITDLLRQLDSITTERGRLDAELRTMQDVGGFQSQVRVRDPSDHMQSSLKPS